MPIVLFTDFGWNGPYVGQMKAVLHQKQPAEPVIDLMHDAPRFQPLHAGILLQHLLAPFAPGSLFLCVVDPGVGSADRKPVIIKADQYWFVGPHNGLFDEVIRHAEHVICREITWQPEYLSESFHGRDLFAPIAAAVATGKIPESNEISAEPCLTANPAIYQQVIYIDHFGNVITGLAEKDISKEQQLLINNQLFSYARTFAEVAPGEGFWYINSMGLVEVAINCGSMANRFGIRVGTAAVVND